MAPLIPPGKFIVVDGPDFCGKGTQCELLEKYLKKHPRDKHKQFDVWDTREPWHSKYGKRIRVMLETEKDPRGKAREFTDLYIKDRAVHVPVIRYLIKKGSHVLGDRYYYATGAYQGAQGVSMKDIFEPQRKFPVPDLAIILLTSVEESTRRKAADRQRPYDEVFEKSHEFMAKVYANYKNMVAILEEQGIRHNLVYVDGERSIDAVFQDMKSLVDKLLFP
jgi:dTMP kinase